MISQAILGKLFLALTAAAFLAGAANADTITFTDVNGRVTGTTTFAGDFPCGPTTGQCEVIETGLFSSSATSSWVDTAILSPIYIGDSAGDVSAELSTVVNAGPTSPGPGYAISIVYYLTGGLDLSSPFTCASVGGCQVIQDGALQFLGETTFNPTTVYGSPVQDPPSVVNFQFVNTPEPASVVLFAAGLVGLAGLKSSRRR